VGASNLPSLKVFQNGGHFSLCGEGRSTYYMYLSSTGTKMNDCTCQTVDNGAFIENSSIEVMTPK